MIARLFKFLIIAGILIIIAWLIYGSYTNHYGFRNIYKDGRDILFSMQSNSSGNDIVFTGKRELSTDREIINAIDYKNPVVRNFAVAATNEFFRDEYEPVLNYRTLTQCFAVFKKINSNWNYVCDPKGEEYIAKASESVKLLAGDCDDHSVLMAAAIKSIGGTPRLVYTDGHIYPEILIGNKRDLNYVSSLIHDKLFPSESAGKVLHCHTDEKGNVWMNLDYTANYPGGKFMSNNVIECLYP